MNGPAVFGGVFICRLRSMAIKPKTPSFDGNSPIKSAPKFSCYVPGLYKRLLYWNERIPQPAHAPRKKKEKILIHIHLPTSVRACVSASVYVCVCVRSVNAANKTKVKVNTQRAEEESRRKKGKGKEDNWGFK